MTNVVGDSNDPNVAAVFGVQIAGTGAVIGQSNKERGVIGISDVGQGVWGASVLFRRNLHCETHGVAQ